MSLVRARTARSLSCSDSVRLKRQFHRPGEPLRTPAPDPNSPYGFGAPLQRSTVNREGAPGLTRVGCKADPGLVCRALSLRAGLQERDPSMKVRLCSEFRHLMVSLETLCR